jgi:hypothetical protein
MFILAHPASFDHTIICEGYPYEVPHAIFSALLYVLHFRFQYSLQHSLLNYPVIFSLRMRDTSFQSLQITMVLVRLLEGKTSELNCDKQAMNFFVNVILVYLSLYRHRFSYLLWFIYLSGKSTKNNITLFTSLVSKISKWLK